ncbi:MAG: tetratricopeptide repeat protein [Burkholderiales bacterium]|jgi:Tfp pilus assembly protein PilF
MPLTDTRALPTGASSEAANAAVSEGIERLLGAQVGTFQCLKEALLQDPDCALAHAVLARHHQVMAEPGPARAALERALQLAPQAPARVQGVVGIFDRLMAGDGAGAIARIQQHLTEWPRDMLAMAPSAGVFGLFGFSGKPGREVALLEFLQGYREAVDDDWWFQSALAFALSETGQIKAAREQIEHSLAQRPQSANGAHIRTHVAYEAGEHAESRQWLQAWFSGYEREGLMHCHLGWHLALAALQMGDLDAAWNDYQQWVAPGAAWGPPLNLVTDSVSFLMRMQWAGTEVPAQQWQTLSEVAQRAFAKPGLSFADLHVVIGHAMAGADEQLAAYTGELAGSAGDLVSALARGFQCLMDDEPAEALDHWQIVLEQNARLGGSRAQRDLIAGLVNAVRAQRGQLPVGAAFVRPDHGLGATLRRGGR